jgi:hypothetical protein
VGPRRNIRAARNGNFRAVAIAGQMIRQMPRFVSNIAIFDYFE